MVDEPPMDNNTGNDDDAPPTGFEISAADLKTIDSTAARIAIEGATAFSLRDMPVMLAADVALIFGVETREIVQNIKANPEKFPERYAFQVTAAEAEVLRSAGLISKPGRGGSRALPWVVTRKGSFRLVQIMKSERAIHASDIFVDIFDEVVTQLQAGARQLTITNPSRIAPTQQDRGLFDTARAGLADAMRSLFDTVIDARRNATVSDVLQEGAGEAVGHVMAWLRGKSLANDKLEADTILVIEQARDMYERRQADLADKALDRELKVLEIVRARVAVAQEMLALYQKLEPNALIDLTDSFAMLAKRPEPAQLPPPDKARI
jgi:hypothetical protein